MQIVKLQTKTVTKIEGVQINLTIEEAITLRSILAGIGGCPEKTARKYVKSICDSLGGIGIPYMPDFFNRSPSVVSGSLEIIDGMAKNIEILDK